MKLGETSMKTQLAKLALAATLTLAITLTLTACDEKKKQDGTDTTASEPAAEAATQEAVAEKLAEKAVLGSFTDPRDNKTYKTVKIGEQVWMAENLNFEAKDSKCGGTVLEYKKQLEIYDSEDGEAETYSTYQSYSLEDKNTVNCDKYGRLYEWETAKTACPSGWHLPSNKEWDKLLHYVDGTSGTESPYKSKTAGKYLKAESGWENNKNGTDKFGFSALPGGFGSYKSDFKGGYESDGDFGGDGSYGYWWNSSDDYYRSINHYNEDGVDYNKSYSGEKELYSVRCIKD
jgi:uncharacterized protein (TIGR02145 family)